MSCLLGEVLHQESRYRFCTFQLISMTDMAFVTLRNSNVSDEVLYFVMKKLQETMRELKEYQL